MYAVNEHGRRIGEGHPKARYSDAMVQAVQNLAAMGICRMTIAKTLRMPYTTVLSLVSGRTRCQSPDRWVAA